jgi:hypothetical protein
MILLAISTRRDLKKKEKKSKKTVTGHMQNRSVTDYLFTSRRKFIITNIDKVYSKITTISF